MLTREIMGVLALAILWVTTLLVAASALKQAAALRRRARALRLLAPGNEGEGLLQGTIAEGDGDGAIARWELEQLGRAGAEESGRRTVHWSDRTFAGAVLGGVVSSGEARVRLSPGEAEVWPAPADVLAAAACADRERFDGAFDEARKARGHARRVEVRLRAGQPVWIAGAVIRSADGLALHRGEAAGLLVSALDPRAWLRRAIALAVGFALAETAVAAAITALTLVPPVFDGWPSRIGGILGLAFFLGVQPLGTAVRDAVRPPGRAFVRGRWLEPDLAEPKGAALQPHGGRSEQQRVPVE